MPTIRALVRQSVTIRNHLWDWRDFSLPQAAAADHQITQAIQQTVINIVFRDRGQNSSPVVSLRNAMICFGILERH